MNNNYNYLEAITDDVKEAIKDSYDKEEIIAKLATDREEFAQKLNDDLWTNDSVTGNASGSYTFSTYKAEENLAHNMEILAEACEEFGQDMGEAVKRGAEYCDVTIRCYYLGQAIEAALDELEEEYSEEIENYTEEE